MPNSFTSPLIWLSFTTVPLASLGCNAKTGVDTDTATLGSSDETSQPPDGTWAIGNYYKPIHPSEATYFKPTLAIHEDFTVTLESEVCEAGIAPHESLRWQPIDPDTIEISAQQEGDAFSWFGGKVDEPLRMRRSDDADIVSVANGDFDEAPELGDFRRGFGCLKIVNEAEGCNGGAFVFPCSEEVTGG